MHGRKRLLIVSIGPFPTPEHSQVEGGGLRCWGLANGLRANMPDLEITLAFMETFRKPGHTRSINGITIQTWDMESLPSLVHRFDSVLASYCMGDVSVRVMESLRPEQQLILDCYVPIFVEASARASSDPIREYEANRIDVKFWVHPMSRGDIFLCANPAQERYYQGVLSAIGRINPLTYGSKMILEVPYGIHREAPTASDRPISRITGESVRKILWFGGIYPWFDLRNLIDAVAMANQTIPLKLVIVGAKNPFTTHPDFLAKYQQLADHAALPENQDLVVLQDWVSFQERANWYIDSDLVVVVNKPGDENSLSWRTRLADFTWASVPIVTNGGDPLGEQLIEAGAAARFSSLSPSEMAEDLLRLLRSPETLESLERNLENFKQRLYWDTITAPLARAISDGYRALDLLYLQTKQPEVNPELSLALIVDQPQRSKLRRVYHLAQRIPGHMRKHGIKRTASAIHTRIERQIRRLRIMM